MKYEYTEDLAKYGTAILCNGKVLDPREILKRLKSHELARQLSCDAPELNMSNYNEDDVSILNQFGIEIYRALEIGES